MSNCLPLNVKTVKNSELVNYSSTQLDDIILVIEKKSNNFYSRKTTFSDFVHSIVQLTSSLSGNVNGNLIGNLKGDIKGILYGNVSGSFEGTINNSTGSIKGISFTTFNNQNISFEGTASYSVSSSYSKTASYSNNSLSSSYSSLSSYITSEPDNYISDFSINSNYSLSSSLSFTSSVSKKANFALSSVNSDVSEFAYDGLTCKTSSYSDTSVFNNLSLHTEKSKFAQNSSFVLKSLSSSYSNVSKFSTNYPNNKDLLIPYFRAIDSYFPLDSRLRIDDVSLNLKNGTGGKWVKIVLDKAFPLVCGGTADGKLPYNTEFIDVFLYLQTKNEGVWSYSAWSADPFDPRQPTILADWFSMNLISSEAKTTARATTGIFPVKPGKKPGDSPSFYIWVRGPLGSDYLYVLFEMYIKGFFTTRPKCN